MCEIQLTQGQVTLVDDEDYDALARHNWMADRSKGTFYAVRAKRIDGKTVRIRMHRVILHAPEGQDVDHVDGDGLNNQRLNLRPATHAQNVANRVRLPKNMSGRRGVSWHRQLNRWVAQIGKDDKRIHLGLFTDLDDAARAYDEAARNLFGEFARLNFPTAGEQTALVEISHEHPPSQQIPQLRLPSTNTSGYLGVSWSPERHRWQVGIVKDGKRIALGRYVDRDEAARVYDAAARLIHGALARCNFPPSHEQGGRL